MREGKGIFFADLPGKTEVSKKGKMEKKRGQNVNCEKEGVKFKMGGENYENEKRTFVFVLLIILCNH